MSPLFTENQTVLLRIRISLKKKNSIVSLLEIELFVGNCGHFSKSSCSRCWPPTIINLAMSHRLELRKSLAANRLGCCMSSDKGGGGRRTPVGATLDKSEVRVYQVSSHVAPLVCTEWLRCLAVSGKRSQLRVTFETVI